MKIRVGIWKILKEMTTNIAIFSAFIAYNAGKRNWDGVWILIGALIFVIIAVWIGVNVVIEWKKKRR